jgi:hypothetical protein
MVHDGKPEGSHHQSVQAINKAITGIRNKLGFMQCQNSMAGLAACTWCNAGHFNHVM